MERRPSATRAAIDHPPTPCDKSHVNVGGNPLKRIGMHNVIHHVCTSSSGVIDHPANADLSHGQGLDERHLFDFEKRAQKIAI